MPIYKLDVQRDVINLMHELKSFDYLYAVSLRTLGDAFN